MVEADTKRALSAVQAESAVHAEDGIRSVPTVYAAPRKRTLYMICALLFVSVFSRHCLPAAAQADISVKTSMASGFARFEMPAAAEGIGEPVTLEGWRTQGAAKLTISSPAKNQIKSVLSASYNFSAVPPDGTETFQPVQTFAIDRAYFKMKLPWISDSSMRLSVGKMPIAWGFGMYFNAGDVIFGSSPVSSGTTGSSFTESSLADLRTLSAWAALSYMPISDAVYLEAAVLPPSDLVSATGESFNQNDDGKTGARIGWNASLGLLETAEAGWMWNITTDTHNFYAAFDGIFSFPDITGSGNSPVDLDWNICGRIDYKGETFETDNTCLSAALFTGFTIPGEVSSINMTIRTECLYYPVIETIDVFALLSASFSPSFSCSTLYMFSHTSTSNSQTAALTFSWIPLKNMTFSLTGGCSPDDITTNFYALISAEFAY